jgi:hypothetical protein
VQARDGPWSIELEGERDETKAVGRHLPSATNIARSISSNSNNTRLLSFYIITLLQVPAALSISPQDLAA